MVSGVVEYERAATERPGSAFGLELRLRDQPVEVSRRASK